MCPQSIVVYGHQMTVQTLHKWTIMSSKLFVCDFGGVVHKCEGLMRFDTGVLCPSTVSGSIVVLPLAGVQLLEYRQCTPVPYMGAPEAGVKSSGIWDTAVAPGLLDCWSCPLQFTSFIAVDEGTMPSTVSWKNS
ncbi:hypothetical protein EMCRGX_G032621 [Ephydatia muelleri]